MRIILYDLRGAQQEVLVSQEYLPGNHKIAWEPVHHPNGLYFYRMETAAFTETKKLVILK